MSATLGYITAGLQYGVDSILVKPKRAIGPFTAQVTIEESHRDELEITDHPVEQGATISDHAYMRPAEVTIQAGWSNSPTVPGLFKGIQAGLAGTVTGVQSLITGNNADQIRDIYAKLLKLQSERIPFDVYTSKRIYKTMLLKSLITTSNKDSENSLMITAVLRQVIIVKTRVATLTADQAAQLRASSTQPPNDSGTRQLGPSNRYNHR